MSLLSKVKLNIISNHGNYTHVISFLSYRYSWDEGLTWSYHQFNNRRMRIYGLLTEPGEKTTVFTLFGSYSGAHSWVLMQIDMKNVLGTVCLWFDP